MKKREPKTMNSLSLKNRQSKKRQQKWTFLTFKAKK